MSKAQEGVDGAGAGSSNLVVGKDANTTELSNGAGQIAPATQAVPRGPTFSDLLPAAAAKDAPNQLLC